MHMNPFARSKADAYDSLSRDTRKHLSKAGAEAEARAELAAMIDEVARELEAHMSPDAARAIASLHVPPLLGGALMLRSSVRDVEKVRRGLLDAFDSLVSPDATVEAQIIARTARRRVASLIAYPKDA